MGGGGDPGGLGYALLKIQASTSTPTSALPRVSFFREVAESSRGGLSVKDSPTAAGVGGSIKIPVSSFSPTPRFPPSPLRPDVFRQGGLGRFSRRIPCV